MCIVRFHIFYKEPITSLPMVNLMTGFQDSMVVEALGAVTITVKNMLVQMLLPRTFWKKDRKSLIHVLTLELIVTATYSAAFNVEIVVEISLLIKLHPQPDGTPCSCTASWFCSSQTTSLLASWPAWWPASWRISCRKGATSMGAAAPYPSLKKFKLEGAVHPDHC